MFTEPLCTAAAFAADDDAAEVVEAVDAAVAPTVDLENGLNLDSSDGLVFRPMFLRVLMICPG